jgi:protein TonB
MERYARFEPALDDEGNPTNGSYSTRITYRLN